MEEIGLPCSVITSHGETSHSESDTVQCGTSAVVPYLDLTRPDLRKKTEESTSLNNVTVYEIVSFNVWPSADSTTTVLPEQTVPVTSDNSSKTEDSVNAPRKRKIKRPYSPENDIVNERFIDKRKGIKKQKTSLHIPEVSVIAGDNGKPFSCDKCQSPFVVNPARSHRLNSAWKYRPRKVTDPSTKKVLVLCNACGLSMIRKRRRREKLKKAPPSQEERETYLKKAAEFALSLANTLQKPDAQRLYCPAFQTSPCQCLQNYLTDNGKDEEGVEKRALHLLTLLENARALAKQKIAQDVNEDLEQSKEKDESEKEKQKQQFPRGLRQKKSKAFEEFVLTNRQYLRKELKLCERGVQRILLYSNNFLHRKLKTSPNRSCRLERTLGKNARGLLKPISDLVNEACCNNRCVAMAQTHSKLLEDWRTSAKKGQREARRVLAEMLTPSGGTKANCFRFISMVTGCSCATICLVNDQMKRTQGVREPPEHGLKKWWRDHPREKIKQNASGDQSARHDDSDEDNPAVMMDVASIHIPSKEELEALCPQEATVQLQQQREKLLEAQKRLIEQQLQIQQQLKQLKPKTSNNKQQLAEKDISLPVLNSFENRNLETVTVLAPADSSEANADILTGSAVQQVLHILELPTNTSPVITNLAENTFPQPTISVMTSAGEFEPLTDLNVSLEARGQTAFNNVVILPESALNTSTQGQGTSVISYSPSVEPVDLIPSQEQQASGVVSSSIESVPDSTKPDVGTFQFYGVMDSSSSNLLHFKY